MSSTVPAVARQDASAADDGLAARPLKVLVVNYRYFVSGGPERYLFNVIQLLNDRGHHVVPFSIAYDRNEPTEFARYFAPPISNSASVYFRDDARSLGTVTRSLERTFYSREVYQRLATLVADEKPDVALVLHYLRKMSPSVIKCLHDHRVPFVVRLSDFGMMCANTHLYTRDAICERCVGGSLRHSVARRCVQGSIVASSVNYAATRFHQIAGYYGLIDRFIVPSGFTLEKMVDAGWDRGRLSHVPTLVAPSRSSDGISDRPPVVVYVGRLDKLKGVHLLLEAVRLLTSTRGRPTFELRIVGSGDADYVETLTNFVSEHGLSNVAFLGERGEDEVRAELRGARCSVAPSLWYENMPNSVLESMAEGTPVVAPDHGSFPEIVRGGETGVLVRPGDPVALADGIEALVQDPGAASRLGARAAEFVAAHHSADRHYERLLNVFSDARQAALKN